MIFEGLSSKMQTIFRNLSGGGRVSEKDVKAAIVDIKRVLLEADVNFKVVKNFINKVSEKAIGQDVLQSLTPGQQIISIIHKELIELLGGTEEKLKFSSSRPTIFMMVGLQGSGKTTTSGKLANWARKQGKNPLLVACDIYRPAAIKQLELLGTQLNIPVFFQDDNQDPVDIAKRSMQHTRNTLHDVVIIDTAGRLHVDEELMNELSRMKSVVHPDYVLLVADAMMGQDSVNVAQSFHNKLDIDGIVLTKLDGDTRGGAALSIKEVTGQPILFAGVGEKLNDLEQFFPERMASRILGMGDVLTLIEKAQEAVDQKKAIEMENKLRTQKFTLEDFLDQMQQIKKMGPLKQLISMIPGIDSNMLKNVQIDDKGFSHLEAIIRSMTIRERMEPTIMDASRKKRVASGSGTSVNQVNTLIKNFEQMKKMMKTFKFH